MKPTVTLSLIVKDELDRIEDIIHRCRSHFDVIQFTVSDKKTYEKLKDYAGVEAFYRKWTNDFAAARNFALEKVKTDYWVWQDADDVVDWSLLPNLLAKMEREKLDALYLPYNYAVNNLNESIAWHWRERIIRTKFPFQWVAPVHETLMTDSFPKTTRSEAIVVNHVKTQEEFEAAKKRNLKILLKEYKKKPRDPRITQYLAETYFGLSEFDKAIPLYLEHIKTSGSKEHQYRSWLQIAEIHWLLDQKPKALAACNEATKILPGYPDAYFKMGKYYAEMEEWNSAIEWFKVGFSKPIPDSLGIADPTERTYRPLLTMAICHAQIGKFAEARSMLAEVLEQSPKNKLALQMKPVIEEGFLEQKAIDYVGWLYRYLRDYDGIPEKLFHSLPPALRSDLRLAQERREIFPPKKWPEKSLVFFCGPSSEPWGPDTLSGGMGGSEEAVVYLSRELAKLGWAVTVFGERDEEYREFKHATRSQWLAQKDASKEPARHRFVTYKSWTAFNPDDTFDAFVAWRNPSLLRSIKARVKCLDMHDMPFGHQAISPEAVKAVDKVFFKSEFQRSYMPELPDDKVVIVSNGVVPEQFEAKVERNPHKVIFGSSADRGLDTLMRLWPEVLKEVPDAELHWYYGWNTFDAFHKKNPVQMKWKYEQVRTMHRLGVKGGVRLSHDELAKQMLSAGVWAYPTHFPEINCITAIKCGLAGMIPVTSGYAALQETVLEPQPNYGEGMTKETEADFVKRLIKALKEGRSEADRQKMAKKYLKFSWSEIAKVWNEACVSQL